jgi:hypothetical protein
MTFRDGFIMTVDDILNDEQIVDAAGHPAQGYDLLNVGVGMRVKLDDAFADKDYVRIRVAGADVFHVGKVFKNSVQDLRPVYAKRRIAALDRQWTVDAMPDIVARWLRKAVQFWWTADPPAGLTADQHVTVKQVGADSFTVAADQGKPVVVRFDAVELNDLGFEQTAKELTKRQEKLDGRKAVAVQTPTQTLATLAQSDLVRPFTTTPPPITIAVAASDDEFDRACVKYLLQTSQFQDNVPLAAAQTGMANGFTDTDHGVQTILLRPGAQGVGTEVHETVHALGSDIFARPAANFLNEGITEYFTRKVIAKEIRGDRYESNTDFVSALVTAGATTDDILAGLYFRGEWDAFCTALYVRAGDLLAINVLLNAGLSDCDAVIAYLNELIQNPNPQLI